MENATPQFKKAAQELAILDQILSKRQRNAAAAETFLKKIPDMLHVAKLPTTKDARRDAWITRIGGQKLCVWQEDGVVLVSSLSDEGEADGNPASLDLVYDPSSNALIGADFDADIAVGPGEYRPRLSAELVLVNAVKKVLGVGGGQ